VLLNTRLDQEQKELIEVIRASGESLLALVNEILDYSESEARALDLAVIDFDLRVAVKEAVHTLAIKAREKGLDFSCEMEPEVSSLVRGDPGRLRQLLLNLTGNAIKFTQQGHIAIRGALEYETDQQVTVRFSIKDTGIGIPRDRLGQLFHSFSQVDGSSTRRFSGTGLGLALSKRLAEAMGGKIGVESEEGKGSTFWFTVALDKQAERQETISPAARSIQGTRVLLVDPNPTNREVLRLQLQPAGCRCAECESGVRALEMLREAWWQKDPFDVVITDMNMPEMDGQTLGREIKDNTQLKNTILILLTALGQRGDAARIKEIGFAAYLTKPVKPEQFRNCLAASLGLREEGGSAPTTLITKYSLAEEARRRVRILLAEGDSVTRKVADTYLRRIGYQTVCAENAEQAVQALGRGEYHIAIVDCETPDVAGTRILGELRQIRGEDAVPAIIATVTAEQSDIEAEIGEVDETLTRPIQAKPLTAAVERRLDAQAAATSAKRAA